MEDNKDPGQRSSSSLLDEEYDDPAKVVVDKLNPDNENKLTPNIEGWDGMHSSKSAEKIMDEQFDRWAETDIQQPGTFQMPTTFNRDPNCVRRVSMSIGHPLSSGVFNNSNKIQSLVSDTDNGYNRGSPDYERGGFFGSGLFNFTKSKSKPKLRRVTEKNGTANVSYKNISKKRRRYFSDIYTTLVDSSWTTSLLIFATSFYMTWLIYAIVYYLICLLHGDFEPQNLPSNQSQSGWTPCIWEIDGFAAAFLFSLETQHTIGYGSRQTTTECVEAMVIMSTQSVLGCLIQAFMVGLVFAKLSTPNKRAKTVAFSKNAVVNERNNKLCMLFRLGDMRDDSFIVGAQISAKIIKRKITAEGEMFHHVEHINISPDSCNEACMFLIWPVTVVHVIDKESPFYRMSAPELASDKFEILITLEGTIEATSMTFQARTSYLPHEILWGHRFEPMMIYRKDHNKYQINFAAFNSTYEVDTPLCSSRDLEHYYKGKKKRKTEPTTLGPFKPHKVDPIKEESSRSRSSKSSSEESEDDSE